MSRKKKEQLNNELTEKELDNTIEVEEADDRGRPQDRSAIGSEHNTRRTTRKKVGRGSKLDYTALMERHPDIFEGQAVRWVADEGGEVQRMEDGDWVVVELPGYSGNSGQRFSNERNGDNRIAGNSSVLFPTTGRHGTAIYMVLMIKDMVLFEMDEIEEQRINMRAQERSYSQGKNQDGNSDRVDEVGSYAPNTGRTKDGKNVRGMSIEKQLL